MDRRPFWEERCWRAGAADGLSDVEADSELYEIVSRLSEDAKVLDLGCGERGAAIFLAEAGFNVTTVDISRTDIAKLQCPANREELHTAGRARQPREDLFSDIYDLIVLHGCLRLIKQQYWRSLFGQIQANTKLGGYNVVAVFTDRPPSSHYLDEFTTRLLRDGELFRFYKGWRIMFQQSYMFDDQHRKGIKHRHAANRIVAKRES